VIFPIIGIPTIFILTPILRQLDLRRDGKSIMFKMFKLFSINYISVSIKQYRAGSEINLSAAVFFGVLRFLLKPT